MILINIDNSNYKIMRGSNTISNNDITVKIDITKACGKHNSRNNDDQSSRYDTSI